VGDSLLNWDNIRSFFIAAVGIGVLALGLIYLVDRRQKNDYSAGAATLFKAFVVLVLVAISGALLAFSRFGRDILTWLGV
jgi:hypothetical protein